MITTVRKATEEYREEDRLHGIEYDSDIMLEGQKVGYITVFESYDEEEELSCAYLASIEVAEEYRNRGIGSQVIRALAEEYGRIFLCPTDDDNARLCTRLGEETERFPEEIRGCYDEWGRVFVIEAA